MAETLVCRGCRNALSADLGCALCKEAKKNLVVEDDGESESLAKMAGSTIRLLRGQLRQLQVQVGKTTEYNAALAREGRQIAGAISKLLDSSRKVIQDGVDAVEVMSFQERAALFLEWSIGLPPAYRRKLYEDLGRHVSGSTVSNKDATSTP